MTTELMIAWIDRILLPYVKQNHALLIIDSYEVHKCTAVLNHLQKHPNIHIGIIVGVTTSYSQPLDITVNKEFKNVCRRKSLEFSNKLITLLDEIGAVNELQATTNTNILLINNQVVIAEKDRSRNRKTKQPKPLTQALLMKKMTVENVYSWIRAAVQYIESHPELVKKGFIKASFTNENEPVSDMDEEDKESETSDCKSMISLDESEIFEDHDHYLLQEDFTAEERFFANDYSKYIERIFEEDSNTYSFTNSEEDTRMDLE